MFRHVTIAIVALALAGCSGRAVLTFAPSVTQEAPTSTILVGTTRAREPDRLDFGTRRAAALSLHRVEVSIPPERRKGEVTVARAGGTPDPKRHFMAVRADLDLSPQEFRRSLRAHWSRTPLAQREAAIFVHGFNNTFAEGLFRTAQISHDLDISAAPIHYSWPSNGSPFGYLYDRDSALFARDGLETLLRETAEAGARDIIVAGHSMGAALTMETLRQLAKQRDGQLLDRIGGIVLFSPDLDLDLFRTQVRAVQPFLRQPIVIFTSKRDSILALSARLAGEGYRLGNVGDAEQLRDLPVIIVDLTAFGDGSQHFKAATSPTLLALLRDIGPIDASLSSDTDQVGPVAGALLALRSVTQIVTKPLARLAD